VASCLPLSVSIPGWVDVVSEVAASIVPSLDEPDEAQPARERQAPKSMVAIVVNKRRITLLARLRPARGMAFVGAWMWPRLPMQVRLRAGSPRVRSRGHGELGCPVTSAIHARADFEGDYAQACDDAADSSRPRSSGDVMGAEQVRARQT
jgi:hypothetical protein